MRELKHLEKDMIDLGIDLSRKEDILESLNEAKSKWSKVKLYKYLAPIALLFIVPFLKWEDERTVDIFNNSKIWKWLLKKFPNLYNIVDRYDNNISINGDRVEWVRDDENGIDYNGIKYSHKPFPLENTKEIRKKSYWTMGMFHPRSKIARYVWLGIRNKASKYALLMGPEIPRDANIDKWQISKEDGNIQEILHYNGYWQYFRHTTVGPLKFRLNLGYKLNIFKIDLTTRTMLTYKTVDVVGNKYFFKSISNKVKSFFSKFLIVIAIVVFILKKMTENLQL